MNVIFWYIACTSKVPFESHIFVTIIALLHTEKNYYKHDLLIWLHIHFHRYLYIFWYIFHFSCFNLKTLDFSMYGTRIIHLQYAFSSKTRLDILFPVVSALITCKLISTLNQNVHFLHLVSPTIFCHQPLCQEFKIIIKLVVLNAFETFLLPTFLIDCLGTLLSLTIFFLCNPCQCQMSTSLSIPRQMVL